MYFLGKELKGVTIQSTLGMKNKTPSRIEVNFV